jgi:hypothetical protein
MAPELPAANTAIHKTMNLWDTFSPTWNFDVTLGADFSEHSRTTMALKDASLERVSKVRFGKDTTSIVPPRAA